MNINHRGFQRGNILITSHDEAVDHSKTAVSYSDFVNKDGPMASNGHELAATCSNLLSIVVACCG